MLQIVITIFFFLAFILHAFLGLCILGLNVKKALNRLYCVIGMCLAAWSYVVALGYAKSPDTLANWPVLIVFLPLFLLLPMAISAYIFAKKVAHEVLPQKATVDAVDFDILDYQTRSRFIKVISALFLCAGYCCLLLSLFYPRILFIELLLSTIYVVMGLTMYSLNMTNLSIAAEDRIITAFIAGSIPLTIGLFFNSMSNILWVIPMILLMTTIIFKRRSMFLLVTGSTLATGLVIWLVVPAAVVMVGSLDYIARLVLYAMVIALAIFFNHTYLDRLNEYEQQAGFQETLSNITTKFVGISQANFDQKVAQLLADSGLELNADSAYLAMFSEDHQKFYYTHQWQRNDRGGGQLKSPDDPARWIMTGAWRSQQLLDNAIIVVESVDALPDAAHAEKKNFKHQQIRSLIKVPIKSREQCLGFIGFYQSGAPKPWNLANPEHLRVLSNLLADAMMKLRSESKITQLAYTDTLTGLPNRVQFYNRLEQAILQAQESDQNLGVIFIDLDGFKEVNDTLGHNWGDYLLKKIAGELLETVETDTLLSRFGGDEFLMLVPAVTGTRQLKRVADRIMAVFKDPIALGGQEFYISASCGIALFPDDGENVHTLIKNADLAMYAAKHNGKAQYIFVTEAMKAQVQEKMRLTTYLRQALEKNELKLVYQPQVISETGAVIGFEALLRWEHPEIGVISPAIFIPIAEETGLINTIGKWVLMSACAQNKAWQDQGHQPVPMAVNLSLEQFRSGDLENMISETLAETGLAPEFLELEITESIAMKDSLKVAQTLQGLKDMGIKISIDDFGTEFSSLIRLKDLPVDRLKIDMAFIQGINVNPKDESIIVVMIQLAKRLGLKVIAEGVENAVQAGFLKDEKCDEIQGYYYFKPLTPAEIEAGIYPPVAVPPASVV